MRPGAHGVTRRGRPGRRSHNRNRCHRYAATTPCHPHRARAPCTTGAPTSHHRTHHTAVRDPRVEPGLAPPTFWMSRRPFSVYTSSTSSVSVKRYLDDTQLQVMPPGDTHICVALVSTRSNAVCWIAPPFQMPRGWRRAHAASRRPRHHHAQGNKSARARAQRLCCGAARRIEHAGALRPIYGACCAPSYRAVLTAACALLVSSAATSSAAPTIPAAAPTG